MPEIRAGATAQVERRVVELDWSEFPIRCPGREDLPASDPNSRQSVLARARERVMRAIEADLADGWALDGDPDEAIVLERRKRQVPRTTPGTAAPQWEDFCAVKVNLRRG